MPEKKFRQLTRWIVGLIIIISSVLSIFSTAIQLYFSYRQDLGFIEKEFDSLGKSIVPAVAKSLYNMDTDHLEVQLDGIISSELFGYAEIIDEESGISSLIKQKPGFESVNVKVREFELPYKTYTGGTTSVFGRLVVKADLNQIVDKTMNNLVVFLGTNFIKALIAGFFIYFCIHKLVTKRILRISRFLRHLNVSNLENKLDISPSPFGLGGEDDIDVLAFGINSLRENLIENLAALKDARDNLQLKVDEQTLELIGKANNISTLLESLDEGIFYIDREGMLSEERSRKLTTILPLSPAIKSAQGFFKVYGGMEREDLENIIEELWNNDGGFFSDFDTMVSLLPSQVEISERNKKKRVHFKYYPLADSEGNLDKLIVSVSDVTEKFDNEQKLAKQSERIERIQACIAKPQKFLNFKDEIDRLMEALEEQSKLGRSEKVFTAKCLDICHTIKGNLRMYGFMELSSLVHNLEGMIQFDGSGENCQELWEEIKCRWLEENAEISNIIGESNRKGLVLVSIAKLTKLKNAIESKDLASVQSTADELERFPAAEVFAVMQGHVEILARRIGKRVTLEFEKDCEEIYRNFALEGAILHILNNAIEHGIEVRDSRIKAGKNEVGRIGIRTKFIETSHIEIFISDDGSGVDTEKLARSAVKSGHWTVEFSENASYEQKVGLIFVSELSSSDIVTEYQGRGVGVSAAKKIIESHGGSLAIVSRPGKGVEWKITIPLNDLGSSRNLGLEKTG